MRRDGAACLFHFQRLLRTGAKRRRQRRHLHFVHADAGGRLRGVWFASYRWRTNRAPSITSSSDTACSLYRHVRSAVGLVHRAPLRCVPRSSAYALFAPLTPLRISAIARRVQSNYRVALVKLA